MSYDTDDVTDKKVREHKTMRLRVPGEPNFCDFEHFCLWHMNRDQQVKSTNTDYTYLVNIKVKDAQLEVDGSEIVTVQELKIPIGVQVRFFEAVAISMQVYAGDGRLIGQEAQFESKTEFGSFLATGLLVKESDDKPLQIKSLEINEVPANFTLDLLGLE